MNCARSWKKAQAERTKPSSACVSASVSRARQARRQAKARMTPAAPKPRCIAYLAATGARCGRLATLVKG